MRSRPDVRVHLDPRTPKPGDVVTVEVTLESHSETPYNAVHVVFEGREKRYKDSSEDSNGNSVSNYHERSITRRGQTFEAGVLVPGRWERTVKIQLPSDLPCSYKSKYSEVAYALLVHVDIPWWPDRRQGYEVVVQPLPVVRSEPKAVLYTNARADRSENNPVLELALEDNVLPQGGVFSGRVAVADLAGRSLRRIEVELATVETPRVKSTIGVDDVHRNAWVLHEGTPVQGETIPFRLQVPSDVQASFDSEFLSVRAALTVRAVVAFGRDSELRVPVTIAKFQERTTAAELDALPVVGRERNQAVWRALPERLPELDGLVVDEARGTASFEFRGVSILVSEESQSSVGRCLVARLNWKPLGMRLRVSERGWTDFGKKIEGLHASVLDRWSVEAREDAQVLAFFDEGLVHALKGYREVSIDDGGAVVVRKGGADSLDTLVGSFEHVQWLGQECSQALERVPCPAALREVIVLWERFAKQEYVSLCRGDVSLRDWSLRGIPLRVQHGWDGPYPNETRIEAMLPPDLKAPASVHKKVQAALEFNRELSLKEHVLTWTLPLKRNPEALRVPADRLAKAVAEALGLAGTGPYRS